MTTPPTAYRLRNWKDYNASLVQRGSLTLWISEHIADGWLCAEPSGKPGASGAYRGLQRPGYPSVPVAPGAVALAFASSRRLRALPVPRSRCHAPGAGLHPRQQGLSVALPVRPSEGARHIVLDSTDLKVLGEGQWKVKKHGAGKRRVWRKLHLSVNDPAAHGEQDTSARQLRRRPDPARREPADESLRAIRKKGRAAWARESGYTRPRLAETQMMRQKRVLGGCLGVAARRRSAASQRGVAARGKSGGRVPPLVRGAEPFDAFRDARQLPRFCLKAGRQGRPGIGTALLRIHATKAQTSLTLSRKRVEEAEVAYSVALQAWDNKQSRQKSR